MFGVVVALGPVNGHKKREGINPSPVHGVAPSVWPGGGVAVFGHGWPRPAAPLRQVMATAHL